MKSNKGITLISIIVYMIALSTILGTSSMIIKYFYKNTEETVLSQKTTDQYSRFIAYISEDLNSRKNNKFDFKQRKCGSYFYIKK